MRKGDPVYGEMSGSGRRRSSKWDLKEESRVPLDSVHEKSWSGKSDLSLHEKESERGWLSPELVSGNRPKWSVPEPLPGRRGSRKNDSIGEDHQRSLKRGMTTWEGEESYGTRMSPGLDEWRHNSPRFEWKRAKRSRSQSRSRSRSVDRGSGKESGLIDRSRSRPVALAQICKDFASGRCRRGNHCQFLHQDGQSYEDNWGKQRNTVTSKIPVHNDSRDYSTGSGRSTHLCSDFLKGNCRRGASCRFDHHVASQLPGKDPSNEATREKNNDGRHRDATPERHGNRETRQLPPCKFFAAGNCRNGKYCRFSHQDQAHASPERSRDDRFSHDRNFDDFGKVWNGPKWSTTSTSGAGKLNEGKSRTDGAPDQSGAPWPVDNRWGPHLKEDKTLHESLADHRMGGSEIKGTLLRSVRNGGDHELGSEQRADESWIGDMNMSPEWNYNVRASNLIDKQHTRGHPNVIQEESGQRHDASAIIPPLVNNSSAKPVDHNLRDVGNSSLPHDDNSVPEKIVNSHVSNFSNIMPSNSFNQNSVNSTDLPLSGVIMVGQSQNHLNQTPLNEDGMVNKPDAVKGPQNMVSSEQLTQLTNISASLAQLLAQGQQLPELYAAHTSLAHNSSEMPSVVYPEGCPKAESTVTTETNETVGKQNRYDPISDSIGFEKHDGSGDPQGITPDLIRQENTTNVKPEILSKSSLPSSVTGTTNDGSSSKVSCLEAPNNKSHQINQLRPGPFSKETKENNGVVTEESRKLEGDKMALENNDPAGNIDGDGKNDDGKKGKDSKGVRAFKFALVEFVKDLLKPTWKEGQMSKDVYKNVVKKVVDKVTGTVQGASIPQTPDKIQQYLSLSKPKLTKLVQAYVEKLQKDK